MYGRPRCCKGETDLKRRWSGDTISLNLAVIWEMSDKTPVAHAPLMRAGPATRPAPWQNFSPSLSVLTVPVTMWLADNSR